MDYIDGVSIQVCSFNCIEVFRVPQLLIDEETLIHFQAAFPQYRDMKPT